MAPLSSSDFVRAHSVSASSRCVLAAARFACASRADSAAVRTSSDTTGAPILTRWPRSTRTLMTLPCVSAVTSERQFGVTVPVSVRMSGVSATAAVANGTWIGGAGGAFAAPPAASSDFVQPAAAMAAAAARVRTSTEARRMAALPCIAPASRSIAFAAVYANAV
jgi:hypothetical protein